MAARASRPRARQRSPILLTWSRSPRPSAPAAASPSPAYTEPNARAVLEPFASPKADHAALTNALRPTSADYEALFDPTLARQIESAQAAEWDAGRIVVKPKDPKQTELHFRTATGAELKAGTGNASEFPGGYRKVAPHVAETATFHTFEFVEPGKSSGTAYDGLAFVNGHWVIVPKPWRALDAPTRAKPKKKRKK